MLYFAPSMATVLARPAAERDFSYNNLSFCWKIKYFTSKLGSRVVGLSKVAEDTAVGRSHDDSPELLLLEVRPCGSGGDEAGLQVNVTDLVPVVVGDVGQRFVAQDSGVVDKNVDSAELSDCRVDDLVSLDHRVVIGHRDAASICNLLYDNIGGVGLTLAFEAASQVVYNHLCTALGCNYSRYTFSFTLTVTKLAKQERVLASQASASARHHNDSVIVSKCHSVNAKSLEQEEVRYQRQ